MDGGLLVGNSHANGGIKIETPEGKIEAEGGEVIINKRAMALDEEYVCSGTPKEITSKVNELQGGVSWSETGTCRLVKKAADGTEISSDVKRADEGIAVQCIKDAQLHIISTDTEDHAEIIEDIIYDFQEGFISGSLLKNLKKPYIMEEYHISSDDIEVIGGKKYVKSNHYNGWIPLYNDEPINLDAKTSMAENGKMILGKSTIEEIGNNTWTFEYKNLGVIASGIIKKNDTIGEFDYVIEDTHGTFDKSDRVTCLAIYKGLEYDFKNAETRFMKTHIKKARWGFNLGKSAKTKQEEKDREDTLHVKGKLTELNNRYEDLRNDYRFGTITQEEYNKEKQELIEEYRPFLEKALSLGVAVNQWMLFTPVKKAERGTNIINAPAPVELRHGMYRIYSELNTDYPEWTGDPYDIKQFIEESKDIIKNYNPDNWEENLEKLGLSYSVVNDEYVQKAANGYFRSQDKSMRPSPSVSATIFPEGYKMQGNDGNMWEISVASNNIHRWVKVKSEDGDAIPGPGSSAPEGVNGSGWEKYGEYGWRKDHKSNTYFIENTGFGARPYKIYSIKKGDVIPDFKTIQPKFSASFTTADDAMFFCDGMLNMDIKAADGTKIPSTSCGCTHAADGIRIGTGVFQGKENWRITSSKSDYIGIFPKDMYTKEQAEQLYAEKISGPENLLPLLRDKYGKYIDDMGITEVFYDPYGEFRVTSNYDIDPSYIAAFERDLQGNIAADGGEINQDWLNPDGITSNGIPFTEDIVSSQGAAFVLFPTPQNTKEDIDKAKSEIRDQRDAVRISIANDEDLDDRYKSAYFRDPRTKELKWYQIEQDEKLIRRERKKGTTPTEFVDQFVLPFIKETEEKYRGKHGDKMYTYSDGGETSPTEKEMRAVYVEAFGKEFDSPERKQPALPLEVAYKIALDKLGRGQDTGIWKNTQFVRLHKPIEEAANGKKVGIVVTKIADLPGLQEKVDAGQVTYRGLGMGKLADDFFDLAGENGTRIKVDGKEYFITDTEFRQLAWDDQKKGWNGKIKFDAPFRKFDDGGNVTEELWFSDDGMTHRQKDFALHILEDYLADTMGAQRLVLVHQSEQEYVFEPEGDSSRIDQKLLEMGGRFEVELYGKKKRIHIPSTVINQAILSIKYPLLTPFKDGGVLKDKEKRAEYNRLLVEYDRLGALLEDTEDTGDMQERSKLKNQMDEIETKIHNYERGIDEIYDDAKTRFGSTLENLSDYTVSLSAEPNPDYDEYSIEGSINIPEVTVPVKDIDEAKLKVREFIDQHNLGSGNWSGGQIYKDGKPIAHISFNGRVWEGEVGNTDYKEFKY